MPLSPGPVLLSLFCVGVLAAAASAQPPLVPSGSFDTPFAMLNWLTNDDPAHDFAWSDEDLDAAPDSGSLRIATNAQAAAALAFSSCRQARPGTSFAFRAWHLSPGPIPGRASVHLYWAENCPLGALVGTSELQTSTELGPTWTLLEGIATAPPGTGAVRVAVGALKQQNAPAPYLVHFDEVALPEPAGAGGAAAGALALLARRRRYASDPTTLSGARDDRAGSKLRSKPR